LYIFFFTILDLHRKIGMLFRRKGKNMGSIPKFIKVEFVLK
jgi:hypothetical protein